MLYLGSVRWATCLPFSSGRRRQHGDARHDALWKAVGRSRSSRGASGGLLIVGAVAALKHKPSLDRYRALAVGELAINLALATGNN